MLVRECDLCKKSYIPNNDFIWTKRKKKFDAIGLLKFAKYENKVIKTFDLCKDCQQKFIEFLDENTKEKLCNE